MVNIVERAALLAVLLPVLFEAGKWLSPLWRSKYFPVWQSLNQYIITTALWYPIRKKPTWLRVNKKAVVNNKFIIRKFSNVLLHWKTTGDFADYLVRVEVENLYVDKEYEWIAIFHFKKTPVVGDLELKYI